MKKASGKERLALDEERLKHLRVLLILTDK